MALKNGSEPIGVLGSGSFGTAVANLLAVNQPVLLYTRREEVKEQIKKERKHLNQEMRRSVEPIMDLAEVADRCKLIFPTVPSGNFRELMKQFAPYVRPEHVLIHGTKGLDFKSATDKLDDPEYPFSRADIATMSEVMLEETVALRVGAMAGPNLASELASGRPAATVIASHFDDVIDRGRKALRSGYFQVYGNHDLTGVELCGVLKNAIAIGSGIITGLELGENARSLLITKGLGEIVRLGQALGSDTQAFFGLAGIGDLMATCNSRQSRNNTVGFRLAQGESLEEILETSTEIAEGVNTIRLAKHLGKYYDIKLPIINTLYEVMYGDYAPKEALTRLMGYTYARDVDFL